MVKLIVNGQDRSEDDIIMALQKDDVLGTTNLELYSGYKELKFNDDNCDIKVIIELTSHEDLSKLIDDADVADVHFTNLARSISIMRRELDKAKKLYDDLSEKYNALYELEG